LRVPSFCYILGDLIYYNGERSEYYPQFYEPYAHYPAPILAIGGNHDGDPIGGGEASLAAFMDNFCAATAEHMPEAQDVPREAMTQPNVYWTLEAPFVWIVGLYTNVPEGGQLDDDQIAWLHSELASVPADVALLVTMHHPIYSMDQFHGGSAYMGGLLDAAVAASGRTPDAVLTGHVHNYQRFTRAMEGRELPYIVSGAGGYWHLHYMAKDDQGLPLPQGSPWPVPGTDVILENYCEDRHGFLRLTASRTALHGEYVSVPHSHESWRNGPVTTVDTFTLDLATHTLGGIPSPAPTLLDTARLRTDAEDARRYLEEAMHHVRSTDGRRLVGDAEAAISKVLSQLPDRRQ
jgi:3',5'-cyclic AMP phosphodiesterase CpdA